MVTWEPEAKRTIFAAAYDCLVEAATALLCAVNSVQSGPYMVRTDMASLICVSSDMHIGRLVRCVWSLMHTSPLNQWLDCSLYLAMVVRQSTVLPPTFSYIFFLHARDKSHHEACLHLPQFLYFAALLSCFAAPHIIFPLKRVWQFMRSLLSPLRLVVCVVMGVTVCTVGGHASICMCVRVTVFKCWASTYAYTFKCTI